MGKYGLAATKAINIILNNLAETPVKAWELATSEVFGEGTAAQKKGCPKGAFLGLCEEGKVKGIRRGSYSRSRKNKEYALKAIEILKNNHNLSTQPDELWRIIQYNKIKVHNQQMDVVCTLWNKGYIIE